MLPGCILWKTANICSLAPGIWHVLVHPNLDAKRIVVQELCMQT